MFAPIDETKRPSPDSAGLAVPQYPAEKVRQRPMAHRAGQVEVEMVLCKLVRAEKILAVQNMGGVPQHQHFA